MLTNYFYSQKVSFNISLVSLSLRWKKERKANIISVLSCYSFSQIAFRVKENLGKVKHVWEKEREKNLLCYLTWFLKSLEERFSDANGFDTNWILINFSNGLWVIYTSTGRGLTSLQMPYGIRADQCRSSHVHLLCAKNNFGKKMGFSKNSCFGKRRSMLQNIFLVPMSSPRWENIIFNYYRGIWRKSHLYTVYDDFGGSAINDLLQWGDIFTV